MSLPWNLIRTFDAVAQTGSLSAAARMLGLTQPAVSRHIDVLETDLRMQLFQRGREGMSLTAKGADLVPVARDMVANADRFGRVASGLEHDVAGTVRISANDVMGVLILPNLLAAFQSQHPEIEVELSISNAASNLLQRDADLALRMFRPVQNDLVARKVAALPLGFYAQTDYLKRAGRPDTLSDLGDHRLIGFDQETGLIAQANAMGIALSTANFQFRSDNILAQIGAIRAGAGVGLTHLGLAAHWPETERVLQDVALPPLDLWMVCHADVQHNKRVRYLMTYLSDALRDPYAFYQH